MALSQHKECSNKSLFNAILLQLHERKLNIESHYFEPEDARLQQIGKESILRFKHLSMQNFMLS